MRDYKTNYKEAMLLLDKTPNASIGYLLMHGDTVIERSNDIKLIDKFKTYHELNGNTDLWIKPVVVQNIV